MCSRLSNHFSRGIALLATCSAMLLGLSGAHASSREVLSDKLLLMRGQLQASAFQRPLLLQAKETATGWQGEVYAIVDHPVSEVATALRAPEQWCAAMRLHINNRACAVSKQSGSPVILLRVVRSYDRAVDTAFAFVFDFHLLDSSSDHLEVRLGAVEGPLGTGNYRVAFEAVAVDANRSFVHFSYGYEESAWSSAAIQAYLATFGRSKLGFTVIGRHADGTLVHVGGERGLVERNAMRYFLALEAQLSACEARAREDSWYTATERYPQQLHEVDRATYLSLKAADDAR